MATFPGWEQQVLTRVGAPVTDQNVLFLDKWQVYEGGTAANNPLNTTQPYAGATAYNSVGVRNYPTAQAGAVATAQTLQNGHYPHLLQALRSGNAPLQAQRDPTGVGGDLQTWGTGHFAAQIKVGTPVAALGGASGLAGVAQDAGSVATKVPGVQQVLDAGSFLGKLADPAFILRAVEVVGGGLLVLLGLFLLAKQVGLGLAAPEFAGGVPQALQTTERLADTPTKQLTPAGERRLERATRPA